MIEMWSGGLVCELKKIKSQALFELSESQSGLRSPITIHSEEAYSDVPHNIFLFLWL